MNKTLIEIDEVEKCLNIFDCFKYLLFQYDFNLVEVHLNIFDDDDKI